MGIYPEVDYVREGNTLTQITSIPGLKTVMVFELITVINDRTDCFCCSCGDYGADAACRNHGYFGKRPCEEHNMPGSTWEDSDEMPDSVQVIRAIIDEQRKKNYG